MKLLILYKRDRTLPDGRTQVPDTDVFEDVLDAFPMEGMYRIVKDDGQRYDLCRELIESTWLAPDEAFDALVAAQAARQQ